jgi:hypothetical protein
MNFGETLGYWYLRLNGFISMRNFVLHRRNIDDRPTADTDLLAVRFPHVYEQVGGQPMDWDRERFRRWGIDLDRNVALIVEVKTGRVNPQILGGRDERLRAALRRLGIFEREHADELAAALSDRALVQINSWTIAKLLITNAPVENQRWLGLTLEEADNFVVNRMITYKADKLADRLFFPDDLLQYLAWKS